MVASASLGGWVQRGDNWTPTVHALQLWESATGRPVLRIPLTNEPRGIAFSSDGRTLASVDDRRLQLWDVATGRELLTLPGPDARVSYDPLAFSPDGARLAVAYEDTTAVIWDMAPGLRAAGVKASPQDAAALDRLWTDLASDDAVTARTALATLVAAPADSLPCLKERLRPAAPLDVASFRRRVGDLDSAEFDVRESAARELLSLDRAEPLREALEKSTSAECRRRLESILTDLRDARPPDSLRNSRAIEVLEQVGTPAARQILDALAAGDPTARRTIEAQAALLRMQRRAPP
jgi:hypothetical protein